MNNNLSANCQVFVPRGVQAPPLSFTSESQKVEMPVHHRDATRSYNDGGFGDFSNQMLQVPTHQPKLNYAGHSVNGQVTYNGAYQQNLAQDASPRLYHAKSQMSNTYNQNQGYYPATQATYNAAVHNGPQQMPEIKMSFAAQNGQRRQNYVQHTTPTFEMAPNLTEMKRRQQWVSSKNVFQSAGQMSNGSLPSVLPLKQAQQAYIDSSSPITKSTNVSSAGSQYGNDDEPLDLDGFDSPVHNQFANQRSGGYSTPSVRVNVSLSALKNAPKNENGWKKKVKTELCKFWLNGQDCENSQKEQGCGFAHGQDELQKKKGLSRQYLTSVCKNFLDHPSKCTYGQRCIFQHPTYDVRKRQSYRHMMQDNARYTAMRLFQDIEGSETLYINTYAASTPRLNIFRNFCSSAKDNGEDYVDPEEGEEVLSDATSESSTTFSRDLFRSASH